MPGAGARAPSAAPPPSVSLRSFMSVNPAVPIGVLLTTGPTDWQIIQRDAQGFGRMDLAGRWVCPEAGWVEARLVDQDTATPASRRLDWQPAETRPDGTWSMTLSQIPAGGLYRLE